MTKKILLLILIKLVFIAACGDSARKETKSMNKKQSKFVWNNANVYFLLTDRFCNADKSNDVNFGRTEKTSELRTFLGGDIKGITKKIKESYFSDLGINVIWLSPIVEQIHGYVDEGQGKTYGYHGYWTKDWTRIDANFGTEEDMLELVTVAHENGIRILLDVVLNHTGPVTPQDEVWPADWVRTDPACTYTDYKTTVSCTLVKNLPDIRTESQENVELPEFLKEKWKKEGRFDKETAELEAFFTRTGMHRTPSNYIIKWLTDFIRKYGIDGYRIDTVKHVEKDIWADLIKEAKIAFADWKKANPEAVLDDNDFYVVGELYGYNINSNYYYNFSDKQVNYFDAGFNSLINFGFKYDAAQKPNYEELFAYYSTRLNDSIKGKTVMNYISSHDDGEPFDKMRTKPFEAANKLLLTPGVAQIYYGDESSRLLYHQGAEGDTHLRTFMNWDEIDNNKIVENHKVKDVLKHWQKLGRFRNAHPAVGAGVHKMLSESPYYFSRTYKSDKINDAVIVGLNLPKGNKEIFVKDVFEDGVKLKDYYTGSTVVVKDGKVSLDTESNIILLGLN